MTKRTIAAASVLILLLLGAILYRPTDRSISKVLGSREYVRIISKADRVDLYQTARFLAMLTNGPPADSHAKVAPGTNVPPQIWSHMSAILLNPQTYSENQDLWGGTASMAPELILTVSSAGATIDIGLADDLKELTIMRDMVPLRKLRCEPGRHDIERALAPLLREYPPHWHHK